MYWFEPHSAVHGTHRRDRAPPRHQILARVAQRLGQMGVPEAAARYQAQSLPQEALAHYAAAPETLRFVGQDGPSQGQDFFAGHSYNLWYETALGVLALGVTVLGILYAVNNNED